MKKMTNTYTVLVEKPKREGTLEKPGRTFDDTKMARKERGRQGPFL
jgi:hypothetical protein